MGFKEIADLSTDITTAIGGKNKKTGKDNPDQIEGYYLGAREVADKKKKDGKCFIYAFQTADGNVGVWGKTDLDRKMLAVQVGTMVRVTHSGFQATPLGDMYKYKVEVDSTNRIEVVGAPVSTNGGGTLVDGEDNDDTPLDEQEPPRATPPPRAAQSPSAERQAQVQNMLRGTNTKRA